MRVLIIDDEPIIRRSLRRVAEKNDFEVEEAQDGLEGLQKWKQLQPNLVFLDILMPGLSGPEVLNKVKKEKNCKVVLMSAYTGDYNVEKAQSLGADLFLVKPFDDIFKTFQLAVELLHE